MLRGTCITGIRPSVRQRAGSFLPSFLHAIWWRSWVPGGLALLLVLSACDPIYLPSQGDAGGDVGSAVGMIETKASSGIVGERLTEPVSVRVVDGEGRVLRGQAVRFVPLQNAGSVSSARTTTDSEGMARTEWTLGTAAGEQRLEARLEATGRRLAVLRVQAMPGPAVSVSVIPAEVSVSVGTQVKLEAVAVDRFDNPAGGADVGWTSSDPQVASVDAVGWVIGLREGSAVVEAHLRQVDAPQLHHRPDHERNRSSVKVTEEETTSGGISILSGNNQSGAPGETLPDPLTVRVTDADGNAVRQADVRWSVVSGGGSTSASLTRTDGQGRASVEWTLGSTTGDQQIEAAASGYGSVVFAATARDPSDPQQVTDLAVQSTGSSSARLTFTEVDDGTGSPAEYEVRYHPHPIGWGWGQASLVTEGSCAGTVTGTSVGASLACTVEGLEPGTKYDFQLVSFRQEERRIFGDLSNVATGTTGESHGEGTITLTPRSLELTAIGEAYTVTAEVVDEAGDSVDPSALSWSSSNPGVVSVDAGGTVVAKGAGIAMIVAAAVCCAPDSLAVTVEQDVEGLTVSPASLSLRSGDTSRLSTIAYDRNGYPIPDVEPQWISRDPGVVVVSSSGQVEAVAEGGTFVLAMLSDVSDSTWVDVSGSGAADPRYPNQPSGFSAWLDHDMRQVPGRSGTTKASGTGYFMDYSAGSNYSVVGDDDFPSGSRDVVRISYPVGHTDGTSPGRFFGWDAPSRDQATALSEWYVSLWLMFEGEDIEGPPNEWKLWYNGIGNRDAPNAGGPVTLRSPGTNVIANAFHGWRINYRQTRNSVITVASTEAAPVQAGRWYHVEFYGRASTPGKSDAELVLWVNGELVEHVTGVQNQDVDGWDTGFFEFHWAPVWGGYCGSTRCPKAKQDALRIGPLYVSGVPQR